MTPEKSGFVIWDAIRTPAFWGVALVTVGASYAVYKYMEQSSEKAVRKELLASKKANDPFDVLDEKELDEIMRYSDFDEDDE